MKASRHVAAGAVASLAIAGCSSEAQANPITTCGQPMTSRTCIDTCGQYADASTCQCALGFVEMTYPDPSKDIDGSGTDIGLNVDRSPRRPASIPVTRAADG